MAVPRKFLKAGALEHLDAISVHPYRSKKKTPETAAADYAKLRAFIEQYAPNEAKKKTPIISGEWGYSSHTKNVSVETQAVFFARQQIANVLAGVPISIWYDWKNDGTDPNENEHNFGTVTHDLKPKPAYIAAQTLTRELKGFSIVERLPSGTNDFVLLLKNSAGATKLAAWTLGDAHAFSADFKMPLRSARAVNALGEKATAKVSGTQIELPVSFTPIYVTLEK